MSFLLSVIKNYVATYSGLTRLSWHRMLVFFINSISYGIVFFLSYYFTNVLNIKMEISGLILSCYGLGKVLGGIIGGKLSDKIPPITISIISLIIKAVVFFALLKIKLPVLLMVNLFILGLSEYAFSTANSIWILNNSQDNSNERLKLVSFIHVTLNLGIACASSIVGFLSGYSFNYVLIFAGFLPILCIVYLIKLANYTQNTTTNFKKSATLETEIYNVNENTEQSKKVFYVILVCLFLGSLIVSQIGTTYMVYLSAKFPDVGIKGASFLFALNPILIILFQTPFINRVQSYNKMMLAGIGGFLMGLGMLTLNFSFIFSIAVLACVVYTVGEMLFFSTIPLICYQQGGAKKRGQGFGFYQTIYAASTVIGPGIGGYIYDNFGKNWIWYICGIIGLLCLILCNFYKKCYNN